METQVETCLRCCVVHLQHSKYCRVFSVVMIAFKSFGPSISSPATMTDGIWVDWTVRLFLKASVYKIQERKYLSKDAASAVTGGIDWQVLWANLLNDTCTEQPRTQSQYKDPGWISS